MSKSISHKDLDGFDRQKQIQTTSWLLEANTNLSLCTGWIDREWVSTLRTKNILTGEYGPVLSRVALSPNLTCRDAHLIVYHETIHHEKELGYVVV